MQRSGCSTLPALRLPFPSFLPLSFSSFLPGWLLSSLRRLRNASRCFLYMTHTHTCTHTNTLSLSDTFPFLCTETEWSSSCLASGQSLFLTLALRSFHSEHVQYQLTSPMFYASDKQGQTQTDIRSVLHWQSAMQTHFYLFTLELTQSKLKCSSAGLSLHEVHLGRYPRPVRTITQTSLLAHK